MTYTRRDWFRRMAGLGVASPAFLPEQQGGPGQGCSGTVQQANAGPLVNSIVQLVQPDGLVQERRTDGKGGYVFPNATSGPYQLLFRDGQRRTLLHEVRQLTSGTTQNVSVTVDPATKSMLAAYDALQALEALSAFVRSNPNALRKALDQELIRIPEAVADVLKAFQGPVVERRFIEAKAESVNRLAALPLVG